VGAYGSLVEVATAVRAASPDWASSVRKRVLAKTKTVLAEVTAVGIPICPAAEQIERSEAVVLDAPEHPAATKAVASKQEAGTGGRVTDSRSIAPSRPDCSTESLLPRADARSLDLGHVEPELRAVVVKRK